MSYNIDTWAQISCDLIFPESILRKGHPAIKRVQTDPYVVDGEMQVEVTIFLDNVESDGIIRGNVAGPQMFVDFIHMTGEGSGSCMEHLEELLTLAEGTYQAILIWEGGDAIELLNVTEDLVRREELDIVTVFQERQTYRQALQALEAHHVERNRLAGREESRSTTLRIIREALKPEEPPDEQSIADLGAS